MIPPSSIEATLIGGSSIESLADQNASKTCDLTIDAAPPAFVGRFQIERLLGRGAMGSVYLARDPQLNRTVALKIPNSLEKSKAELSERFLREARYAATLNHPNICPVYEVGEHGGTRFLAMGYVDGRPLSDFIKPGKQQPERSIAAAVRKIALAVHAAHEQGIIHRDLKPANIMIDSRKEPIVMDFGLARLMDDDLQTQITQEGVKVGTPSYMSPEQIEGRRNLGPASDIFSLGVILYELLTTVRPFQGSVINVIGQILHKDPEPLLERRPDVSPQLAHICAKAMAKQPEERFASMKEFADALADFLKGKSTTGSSSSLQTTAGDSGWQDADDFDDDVVEAPVPGRLRKPSARKKKTDATPSWQPAKLAAGLVAIILIAAFAANWLQSSPAAPTTPANSEPVPVALVAQPAPARASPSEADVPPLVQPTVTAEPVVEAAAPSEEVAAESIRTENEEPLEPLMAEEPEAVAAATEPETMDEPEDKPIAEARKPAENGPPKPPPPPNNPNFRPPPGGPNIDEEMKRFDQNEDGILSKNELPPFVFTRADRNKDGKVTRQEMEAAYRKYREKLHMPPRGQMPPRPPK